MPDTKGNGSNRRLVLAVTGGERSSSGSDSEIQSAFPFNRTPFMQSPVGQGGPNNVLPLVTTAANQSHMREVMSPGSDLSSPNTAGSSSQSFATASSYLPSSLSIHRAEQPVPETPTVGSGGMEVFGQSPAQPESWTLMFVNKEFSATKKEPATEKIDEKKEDEEDEATSAGLVGSFVSSDSGSVLLTQSQLLAATKAASKIKGQDSKVRRSVVFDAEPIEEDDGEGKGSDSSSLGSDLWDRSDSDDDGVEDGDKSKAAKKRPQSNFKFTPGMRKALLERQPSRNLRDRPTADAIGEHLDRWFPDHDLDKPIIQSVPIDSGLLPSQELNIIVDDEDPASGKSKARQSLENFVRNRHVEQVRSSESGNGDNGSGGSGGSGGLGRRKSVRMLVQETRQRRRKSNLSAELAEHPLPLSHKSSLLSIMSASEAASIQSIGGHAESLADDETKSVHSLPPPAIVRRKSTKIWGCIPEEVRPRRHKPRLIAAVPEMTSHDSNDGTLVASSVSSVVAAVANANADANADAEPTSYDGETISPSSSSSSAVVTGASGQVNVEIVRRALSYLRKPATDPQAEKAIVEAAIRSGDHSAVGSTRAQFVHERERLRGLPMVTEIWNPMPDEQGTTTGEPSSASPSSSSSVKDAVSSLFAKCGLPLTQIKIQWIKGQLIGKGSFGHVYVAINAATGEVIAVKQIALPKFLSPMSTEEEATGGGSSNAVNSIDKAGREEAIRMMHTEVELLKDLDHENIVQLLGFEITGGLMSMFLEYVPGGTVHSLVQQHGPLPEPVVHSFLKQIVAGLQYLHDRGILHRDIKGPNILVDETGTCKISDFGISRRIDYDPAKHADDNDDGGEKNSRKKNLRAVGTVPFMAPEVARKHVYSSSADIWALGCVTLQMWSGQQPWAGYQEPQIFFKLANGLAPPFPDDLTEAGLEFCKRCFVSNPEGRAPAAELGGMEFAQVPSDYVYPYTS
ncbi:mitogen-activated protein kinase kinase kinase [Linderina macrospora]|uniref:Mitogen-activated protein kinase kinase kinase n=1 Tax=Linderina macrospora TaxID=4868 RepID=A0ACC1JC52_9FUNG|nr:mitogen-activated protein kinase kinase kinase [Linderina macrospora]